MCFQVNFKTSHRCIERELESSAKTKASTPLHNSSFAVALSHFSNVGIIFTRILFAKGEKVVKRAYISLKYPFLAIHAKGGESISPKQKDRTTT
jgi:predicted metal-dependent phosphoesterase TrpH